MLSDGTKVHLNAMTSLRFPVTFDNGPRKVELEGEAYFEAVSYTHLDVYKRQVSLKLLIL